MILSKFIVKSGRKLAEKLALHLEDARRVFRQVFCQDENPNYAI